MFISVRILVLLAMLLSWPVAGRGEEPVTLYVDGKPHVFSTEIADDPIERARGLMFRTDISADHGMLFDFAEEAPRSFWMRNTPTALDIIFAEADGDIVAIAENTTPFSEDSIPSGKPARFVFEVVAGTAARIGLEPGDRLDHPRVEPQP